MAIDSELLKSERDRLRDALRETEAQVRKEMSVHPLEWVETSEVLPWQHIIIFRKTSKAP